MKLPYNKPRITLLDTAGQSIKISLSARNRLLLFELLASEVPQTQALANAHGFPPVLDGKIVWMTTQSTLVIENKEVSWYSPGCYIPTT